MQREKRYDVFLSYNSPDKPAVEYLARRLRQGGGWSLSSTSDTWSRIWSCCKLG